MNPKTTMLTNTDQSREEQLEIRLATSVLLLRFLKEKYQADIRELKETYQQDIKDLEYKLYSYANVVASETLGYGSSDRVDTCQDCGIWIVKDDEDYCIECSEYYCRVCARQDFRVKDNDNFCEFCFQELDKL